VAALALLAGGAAGAQMMTPDCTDTMMVGPNPLILTGSSAFQPAAQAVAGKLAALTTADKTTVIYKSTSSCDGVNAVTNDTALTGTATYYFLDTTMTPAKVTAGTCMLPDAGLKPDVGISDIFFETCPGVGTRPATIGDIAGPAQAMLIIVPEANTSFTYITAQEAQLVWGCGMNGNFLPFTDEMGIQQRNSGSGTQNIIAKAIGVPPDAFKGKMNTGSGDLITSLTMYAASNPDKAIGILAADAYDSRRGMFNSIAFRGFDQTKAYYADSAPDTFDKRNVRDGHYLPWGPEHFIVQLGADGKPSNAKAAKWVGWMDGTVKVPNVDFEATVASVGVIPQCAMKVTRTSDGGFQMPFTPADPCGCFFESIATMTTPANCTACTDNTACTGGKTCHHGFCE
jgi:hypothetical protein